MTWFFLSSLDVHTVHKMSLQKLDFRLELSLKDMFAKVSAYDKGIGINQWNDNIQSSFIATQLRYLIFIFINESQYNRK